MSNEVNVIPAGFTGRKAEWLVSACVLVLTFFAISLAYVAQKMEAMFSEFGTAGLFPGMMFVAHHLPVVLGLILLLTATTLWFVWGRVRFSTGIAATGILCLGGVVYYLGVISFVPLFNILRDMGNQ